MKKCLKINVIGKVQGVGYKKFIKKQAEKLSIEGTIQNLEDGNIIIYLCGSTDLVDDFIDSVYKGSSGSKIEDVIVEPMNKEKDFRGVFRIIGANS